MTALLPGRTLASGAAPSALGAWLLGKGPDTVHSFDVFDTTVTRIWRAPSDLFVALGRELVARGLISVAPTDFAGARREAEKGARSASSSGETTLGEIYRRLVGSLGLPADSARQLAAVEVAIEVGSVRRIEPVAGLIDRLAAAGRQVAMTSDTYFSSGEVASLLAAAGLDPSGLALFLSSERQESKRRGDIFGAVRALGRQATHVGDRRIADVENARAAGLDALQLVDVMETRREAGLASGQWTDGLAASAAAGSARSARLLGADAGSPLRTFRSVGAGVAGPVLTAYVGWVLRAAERAGVDRLLFLARDGQILHALANLIAPALGTRVECRYTYASRQALYLPAARSIGDPAWTWLAAKMDGRTVGQVLRRFGLEASIAGNDALPSGLAAETVLDRPGAERLRAWLETPPLAAAILTKAAARRAVARSYYEAEARGSRIAIVDMGWKGRLQFCLERILAGENVEEDAASAPKLDGFYFALDGSAAVRVRGRRSAFADYRKLRNTVLLECLTQADHGSLLGFEADPAGSRPDLAPTEEDALPVVRELQAATLAFASNFLSACAVGRIDTAVALSDLKQPALAAFHDFIDAPSPAEAVAFGDLVHSDDQAHQAATRVAPPLDPRDLWRLLRHGPALPSRRLTYWPEASIRRMAAENGLLRRVARVVEPARRLAGKSMALARRAKRRLLARNVRGPSRRRPVVAPQIAAESD